MRPPKSGCHRTTEKLPLGTTRQRQSNKREAARHNRERKGARRVAAGTRVHYKPNNAIAPLPQLQTLKTAGNIRLPCPTAINPPWTESMALCPPSSSQLTLYGPGGKVGDSQPQPPHSEPSSKGSTALGMKGGRKVAGKA